MYTIISTDVVIVTGYVTISTAENNASKLSEQTTALI